MKNFPFNKYEERNFLKYYSVAGKGLIYLAGLFHDALPSLLIYSQNINNG